MKHQRIDSLDALRGCAALVVVFHHIAMLTIDTLPFGSMSRKLFVLLTFAGHPAVLIFFALSGFVLYINHARRQERYGTFLIKRIFRIYPAFLACFFAIALASAIWPIEWQGAAPKLAQIRSITVPSVFLWPRALTLILTTSSDARINVVFWSLVYEMRFSLLFLPMAALLSSRPLGFIGAAVIIYIGATWWLVSQAVEVPYIISDRGDVAIAMTLHYLIVFALGMLAAHLYQRTRFPAMPWGVDVIATGGVALAMLFLRDDLLLAILGTALVLLAATGPTVRRVLAAKPFIFLGDISYSLYLVHLPLIAFALFWTQRWHAPVASAAVAGLAAILVAWASYVWIEKPGVRAGRSLLDALRRRRGSPHLA